MKFDNTTQFGKHGEQFVCDYLTRNRYKILARNVREKFAEIDIVALHQPTQAICFIEVRTRQRAALGHPAETITEKKKLMIRRAAELYLIKNGLLNRPVQFDAATIVWETNSFEYFENAF